MAWDSISLHMILPHPTPSMLLLLLNFQIVLGLFLPSPSSTSVVILKQMKCNLAWFVSRLVYTSRLHVATGNSSIYCLVINYVHLTKILSSLDSLILSSFEPRYWWDLSNISVIVLAHLVYLNDFRLVEPKTRVHTLHVSSICSWFCTWIAKILRRHCFLWKIASNSAPCFVFHWFFFNPGPGGQNIARKSFYRMTCNGQNIPYISLETKISSLKADFVNLSHWYRLIRPIFANL